MLYVLNGKEVCKCHSKTNLVGIFKILHNVHYQNCVYEKGFIFIFHHLKIEASFIFAS
jgi:hypothetical protein